MTGADRPDDDDDRPRSILRAVLELLRELDDADGRGEHGRRGSWTDGRTSFDYSVSVGGLDDALGGTPPGGRSPGGTDRSDRSDQSDRREEPAVTTRETDDGLLVVVDLPEGWTEGVAAEVDEDERTAVITAGGNEVGQVPLDDGEWTVLDVSVNNGIMEVRLTRE